MSTGATPQAEKGRTCPATAFGRMGDEFSCIWADHGDEKPHDFGIEYRVYGRRLVAHHDAEWLATEVRVLHTQIESMKRDHTNDDTPKRFRRLVTRLVHLAPANATRKTIPLADVRAAYEEAVNG